VGYSGVLSCKCRLIIFRRVSAGSWKPYIWRAEGAVILAKINRARAALDRAEAA
jgi:hypothetical protein